MLSNDEQTRIAGGRLFRGIGFEAIEHLFETCTRRTLVVGETLLAPGHPNSHLYVVLAGELRVYLGDRDLPEHTVLRVGDCAGEMSLIDGQDVSAMVISSLETTLLAIPHDTVWSMVDGSHGLARNLLTILAGRLRHDNLTLVTSKTQSLEFADAGSVDALTGLHNRRWMLAAFPRAMHRCERDVAPLCLILADIDDFKRFNVSHGHLLGDTVLRIVARAVAECLRPQDMVVRYGSAEFAVMLPNTNAEVGMRVAERLRATVGRLRLELPGIVVEEEVTLSCGIAPFRLGDTLEQLFAVAESALDEAKQNGRDRVALSAERA